MTPIFSFLPSRLLYEVFSGAQNVSTINQFGGLVLGMAALDGVFLGLKYYVMEYCCMSWITNLQDARNLISVVWAQFLVVSAMLGVGFIWALTGGRQLTLAGFAVAPVFAGFMVLQT
jgi:ATP-binding cassette, subfamily B (MDR/TAP), member 1